MGRSALSMRAHGLGPSLLRFVALAVLMLAGGRGAVPLSARRLEIQARATTLQCDFTGRQVNPHEALLCLPPRLLCQVTGYTGVESKSVPETFVDLTPPELAKQVHELKHLTSATSQALLPMILKRVGATVADFFDNFSNTTCSEHISSTVDTVPARLPLQYDGKFNYVALAKPGARKTRLEEFRTDSKSEVGQPKGGVVTVGFVSLAVHFHPAYQPDSRFRYLGRELVKGKNTYVVAFGQRPGVARQAQRVNQSEGTEAFEDKFGVTAMRGGPEADGHFLDNDRHAKREGDERNEESDAELGTGGGIGQHAGAVVFSQHDQDAGADEQPEKAGFRGKAATSAGVGDADASWARSTSS